MNYALLRETQRKAKIVDQIRDQLLIADVVRAAGVELRQTGRRAVGLCPFHVEKTPSFHVFEEDNRYKCFGCGKFGDVFDFIAQWKLNLVRPQGDDFIRTIQLAAEMAGIEYDPQAGQSGDNERTKNMRRMGNILTAYAELANQSWTPEDLVRTQAAKPNGAGKSYINQDVIERWHLGIAPSLQKCHSAGLSDDDLRFAGLLRVGRDNRDFLLFRDALIIPHIRAGRAHYLAARQFDFNARCRYLNLPTPDRKTGVGGVDNPLIYNVEAFHHPGAHTSGVLLVEGRLDAIACTERGHPAVAYISAPTQRFVDEISRYKNIQKYYAPDCTRDMTAEKRVEAVARMGPDVMCCALPRGLDPDDLTPDQLREIKGDAHDTVQEWLNFLAA